MIEVKIQIDQIDYGGLAQQALPTVLERLQGSKGDSKAAQALKGLGHLPADAMKMMLNAMPQDVKDSIALAFLKSYQEEIAAQVNRLAAQKGVQLTVTGVEAVKVSNKK
ncbi:MAG: hypothetical protein HDT14_09550 [Oscillibacter sp.]|nr:hypothetical protein [Oscillibacter sp.]